MSGRWASIAWFSLLCSDKNSTAITQALKSRHPVVGPWGKISRTAIIHKLLGSVLRGSEISEHLRAAKFLFFFRLLPTLAPCTTCPAHLPAEHFRDLNETETRSGRTARRVPQREGSQLRFHQPVREAPLGISKQDMMLVNHQSRDSRDDCLLKHEWWSILRLPETYYV